MIRVMLDTSACVDMLRGQAPRLYERLRRLPVGEAGLSSIALAELRYGAARSANPARHETLIIKFCGPLVILAFGHEAAAVYGQVRAELGRAGRQIGPLDTLIAAHALALGATLVTANDREFARVRGLRVENWAQA